MTIVSSVVPPGGGQGALTPDNAVTQDQLPNTLLSGGVAWLGGLDFLVTSWAARIDGVIYTGPAEVVTLPDADDTNPRIDVIAVTSSSNATVIEGTAAANPAKPEVDPSTQIEVTFATVAAMATTPSNISNEDVYLENTEWTSAEQDSGTTIDLAATTDPNTGTKHVAFAAVVDGDYITFTDSTTHSSTEFDRFLFAIKQTVANTNNKVRLRIALYNSTTRVSDWIDLRHGTYDFDGTDTSDYQNITIPMTEFALGGNSFDVVRFEVEANGSNTISCRLDDIKFQAGATVIIQGVTQEDVDLAVLNKPEQFSVACSDLTSDLETGAVARFRPRYDVELVAVYGSVKTAPTGAGIIADIHAGGTTIMATNKINIDATEKDSVDAGTQPALTTTTILAGTEVEIQLDQVGSTLTGAGLVVDFIWHQR